LKKSSKNLWLVLTSARPGTLSPEGQKSWFFFSKKHRFLPLVFASADILRPTWAMPPGFGIPERVSPD
jgi:hypothetical protein